MTEKKMIEWWKFEVLEKKYSKLCEKHARQETEMVRFKKLPQAIFCNGQDVAMYIKKVKYGSTPLDGIIYLKSMRIRKNHCDVCGKRRKTTGHHIIPKRVNSVNKELSQIRIRICRECEGKIHPENGYDKNDILEKQNRTQIRLQYNLKRKASDILKPFFDLIDKRILDIEESIEDIPIQLIDTPRSISPALKKCEGRIKELKYLRGSLRCTVNYDIQSNV